MRGVRDKKAHLINVYIFKTFENCNGKNEVCE